MTLPARTAYSSVRAAGVSWASAMVGALQFRSGQDTADQFRAELHEGGELTDVPAHVGFLPGEHLGQLVARHAVLAEPGAPVEQVHQFGQHLVQARTNRASGSRCSS